jgi:hypothetical protein
MFCKLGKDRTGLLCMALLACCGASEQEIISDYVRHALLHPCMWALVGMLGFIAPGPYI